MADDPANSEIRVADVKISRQEACDLKEKCSITIWSKPHPDPQKKRIGYYSIDMSELNDNQRAALQGWIEKTILKGEGCVGYEWQGNSLVYRFDDWVDYDYFGMEMTPNHEMMGKPRVHYPQTEELGRAWRIDDAPLTYNSVPERSTLQWRERSVPDPTRPTTRLA